MSEIRYTPPAATPGPTGSGAAGQVTFWSAATVLSGNTKFLFNSTTNTLTIGGGGSSSLLSLGDYYGGAGGINKISLFPGFGFGISGGSLDYVSSGDHTFYSSGAKFIIKSTGNVLIGTTTDSGDKLYVNGTAKFSSNLFVNWLGGGYNGMTIAAGDGTTSTYQTVSIGNTVGTKGSANIFIGYAAGLGYASGNSNICIGSGAAQNQNGSSGCVYIGQGAAGNTRIGSYNTYIGYYAGYQAASNGITNVTILCNDSSFGTLTSSLNNSNVFIYGLNQNILVNTLVDIPSSKFTIQSTTQGFLPPRATTAQIKAVSSPAAGLVMYSTDDAVLSFYDGTNWRKVNHSLL